MHRHSLNTLSNEALCLVWRFIPNRNMSPATTGDCTLDIILKTEMAFYK